MSLGSRNSRLSAVGVALLFVHTLGLQGQAPAPDAVAAIVEGQAITHKDIRVPEKSLRLKYRLMYGKYPESPAELADLARLSDKTEKELLTSKIKSVIWRKQIAKFGIAVTKEEVTKRQQEQFGGLDLQAALAQQREALTPLIQALRSLLDKRMDEKLAYETYLAGRMPYEHWLVHRQTYNTPKRIAMLEEYVNKTPEEWRRSDVGTRAWIEEEKLNKEIDAQIAQSDPEFAEYLRARSSGDIETASKIEGTNPNYVHAKREGWWRQRYAEADIKILDKKYTDVLQRLVGPAADPASATNKH